MNHLQPLQAPSPLRPTSSPAPLPGGKSGRWGKPGEGRGPSSLYPPAPIPIKAIRI